MTSQTRDMKARSQLDGATVPCCFNCKYRIQAEVFPVFEVLGLLPTAFCLALARSDAGESEHSEEMRTLERPKSKSLKAVVVDQPPRWVANMLLGHFSSSLTLRIKKGLALGV